MKFCSTQNGNLSVTFAEAVRRGLPGDGGLFTPEALPRCPEGFVGSLSGRTFSEIALDVARLLLADEIPDADLVTIVEESFTFDVPLRVLDGETSVLELFHGPTLAFKDFGARFMARTMSYLQRGEEYTVLVATSGDTGSAVAHAFHGLPGVSVVLLYPSGRVSDLQERQLTYLGGNVTALKIDGTFDDCQRLVRLAFADPEIAALRKPTSANSINVARLLPQTFYYFSAVAALTEPKGEIVFSVPCGNLGNLTAGLFAWKMGLPVRQFIAATNSNDVFGRYLATGRYAPERALQTISNAMDVGDPGNLPRICALFGDDLGKLTEMVRTYSCSDDETRSGIAGAFGTYGYSFDPHGAVAYVALGRYRAAVSVPVTGIVLGTAHPAKFPGVYELGQRSTIRVPGRLREMIGTEKRSVSLSADFDQLKSYLMKN